MKSFLPQTSGSIFYEKKWAKAYAEYDPERANKLLDEIGLDKQNKEGYSPG